MRIAYSVPLLGLAVGAPGLAAEGASTPDNFANMSLEELSDVRVVSVSRREERLGDAPASIFVITAEDLRRAGARSLPEALRLAPNLHVAAAPAGAYAITARGFAGNGSNKQLVMIDGRSIYSPLFSGVFWDAQYLPMDSIERIEVVSGPGGTLWGTNAMNGVINIITKPAAAMAGSTFDASWGRYQSGLAFSHGAPATQGAWRAYAMDYAMPAGERQSGAKLGDAWHYAQAGFRRDWQLGSDAVTLQGDAYRSGKGQVATRELGRPLPGRLYGANLMLHWSRQLRDGGSWNLLAYADSTERELTGAFRDKLDVLEVQGTYNLPQLGSHALALGAGYRFARDRFTHASGISFLPPLAHLRWANLLAQDTWSLSEQLKLIAGLRLERNAYTGTEFLPNLRLSWKATDDALLWTALSRTVRAPTRLDRDAYIVQGAQSLRAGPHFESEVARVLELGYRQQLGNRASFSVTLFGARYDRLRTVSALRLPVLFTITNDMEGRTRGVEAWGNVQLAPDWRLGAGFTAMHEEFSMKPGTIDVASSTRENFDPTHTLRLRSSWTIAEGRDLDVTVRRVGRLRFTDIPGYTALDLNLNWRLRPGLEVQLGASNALDREHEEIRANQASEPRLSLGRGVYARFISRF